MKRSLVIYGILIALAAFAMRWLEYRHSLRMLRTELYVVIVALAFTGIGIWVGTRIAGRGGNNKFERNDRALESLGISDREYDVLRLLASGSSNKEIAEQLFVSPNTVKTHLANLYGKLEVRRRTQAVHKAKALRLIP